eukprot:1124103-Pleurochrysis_carterae.AAC.1
MVGDANGHATRPRKLPLSRPTFRHRSGSKIALYNIKGYCIMLKNDSVEYATLWHRAAVLPLVHI